MRKASKLAAGLGAGDKNSKRLDIKHGGGAIAGVSSGLPLYVELGLSAAQSTSNNVEAAVLWTLEVSDLNNWHDAVTNTDRVTPGVDGLYSVHFFGQWSANSTGARLLKIYKNGTGGTLLSAQAGGSPTADTTAANNASALVRLGPTDYLTAGVKQDAGALTLSTTARFVVVQITA